MRAFLALVLVGLFSSVASADLVGIVVNELMPDPNSATNNFDTDGDGAFETGDEFVELYNTTGAAVDLSGLELWVGTGGALSNRFAFPTGSTVGAGGFATVVTDWDPGTPPSGFYSIGSGSGQFGNGGDNFVLYDPTTNEYCSYTYNGDADLLGNGLPAGATQVGSTIDMGSDTDGLSISAVGDGSTNWVVQGPTPGSSNAVPEPSSLALISLVSMIGLARRRR